MLTWNSSVSTVTMIGLDDRRVGVQFPTTAKIFLITMSTLAVRPPSLLSNVYWELISAWLNQLGHEAGHSPPASSEAYILSPIPEFGHLWVLWPYFLTNQRWDSNMQWKENISLSEITFSTHFFTVSLDGAFRYISQFLRYMHIVF
jgi:hypothetical protein